MKVSERVDVRIYDLCFNVLSFFLIFQVEKKVQGRQTYGNRRMTRETFERSIVEIDDLFFFLCLVEGTGQPVSVASADYCGENPLAVCGKNNAVQQRVI